MSDLYLGLMSGTSLDGIDAAIVDLSGSQPKILGARTQSYPSEFREQLRDLAQGNTANEIEVLGSLDTQLGELFANAALTLISTSEIPNAPIRAIGSHGQTIRHRPNGPHPFTLQIGDPNIIAERTGITTIADFRRRDLAVGGQGAPLVPAFHAACFRSSNEERAVLNLGGMANLTILPADPHIPVTGFDTGPGNVLLDSWIGLHRTEHFDADGHWSAAGTVIPSLLESLMEETYFRQPPPKSTGRELFQLTWLQERLLDRRWAAVDIQATVNALTARSVAEALKSWAPQTQRLLVCGGGAHNSYLLRTISDYLADVAVETTATLGLDPDWIEAAAFAWMARETLAARPSNLPDVTGATHPVILGGIYLAPRRLSGMPE